VLQTTMLLHVGVVRPVLCRSMRHVPAFAQSYVPHASLQPLVVWCNVCAAACISPCAPTLALLYLT
jgi:hypothetical protein